MNGPRFVPLSPWSPAFLGQVRLAGAWSGPAPAPVPPAIGGPTPGRAARPHLGEFSWGRLPTSVLFMTGGGAGLYLGGALPSPADVIIKAAGIAAIGWGFYHLFSEPAVKKAEKSAEQPQEPQRTPSPSAFSAIRGTFVSPSSGTKPEMNFWTDSFDAKVIWYNNSDETVSFTYDVWADVRVPGLPAAQVTPGKSVYTATVKLEPHHDSLPITITVPMLRPGAPGFTGPGLPEPTFRMELTLRKYDAAGNPVPASPTISVGPFAYYP